MSSCLRQLLESVVRTKKSLEECSQRAHATFENGADPSGTDRGLNRSFDMAAAGRPGRIFFPFVCCSAYESIIVLLM